MKNIITQNTPDLLPATTFKTSNGIEYAEVSIVKLGRHFTDKEDDNLKALNVYNPLSFANGTLSIACCGIVDLYLSKSDCHRALGMV